MQHFCDYVELEEYCICPTYSTSESETAGGAGIAGMVVTDSSGLSMKFHDDFCSV